MSSRPTPSPTWEDVKQANAPSKGDDLTSLLLPSSPDSVATTLDSIPSDFTLHNSAASRKQSKKRRGDESPRAHRRALLIVTLILVVWPLVKLATLYDDAVAQAPTSPAAEPSRVCPRRAWTWPASHPRNVTAARRALYALAKATIGIVGLNADARDFWIASMTMDGWTAPIAAAPSAADERPSTPPRPRNTKIAYKTKSYHEDLRLRAGPALLVDLSSDAFGLFG